MNRDRVSARVRVFTYLYQYSVRVMTMFLCMQ
jgi:hypothetical protein